MYQGTTPALTFLISGIDLSEYKTFISFGKGRKEFLTKTSPDVITAYDSESEKTVIICQLTQEETFQMQGGVTVQARFVDESENALATDKAVIEVKDVIYKEIITFGG